MAIRKKGQKRSPIKKIDYDGNTFKSGLEVYCYKKLKEEGFDFSYEEHVFELIKGFVAGHDSFEPDNRIGEELVKHSNKMQSIKYTPDFVGNGWIIETKGRKNESFPIRWKLFRKYLTDNQLSFSLYMPKNRKQVDQTIQLLKQ